MANFKIMLVALLAFSCVLGQEENDSVGINPPECGHEFRTQLNEEGADMSTSEGTDQVKWGWVVFLRSKTLVGVGSLA
jgi:hypothetical protein